LFLRAPDQKSDAIQYKIRLSDFKNLLASPTIWLLGFVNLLMVGTLEGFADVWGVNYLMTAYPISKSDAAALISFIFIGMLFGGPFLAFCSKKIGNFKVIALSGLIMAAIFVMLIWFTHHFNWYYLATLFFCLGVLCCYQVIVFALGSELVSAQLLGVTVAFLNCINMLGGSFFHTLIGFFMDLFWQGQMSDGIRQYALSSYQYALMIIPLAALVGTGIISLLGMKHRQVTQ
jgi:sugar phosphate permease